MRKNVGFFTLSVLLMAFVAACSNDSKGLSGSDSLKETDAVDVQTGDAGDSSVVTVGGIAKDKIPFGVVPLKFDSETQLKQFVKQLKSRKPVVEFLPGLPEGTNKEKHFGIVTQEYKVSGHTVLITISWTEEGKDISVSSRPSDTWGRGLDWKQFAGVAHWEEDAFIDYTVLGSVVRYAEVNVDGTPYYVEIREENVRLEGKVNARVGA